MRKLLLFALLIVGHSCRADFSGPNRIFLRKDSMTYENTYMAHEHPGIINYLYYVDTFKDVTYVTDSIESISFELCTFIKNFKIYFSNEPNEVTIFFNSTIPDTLILYGESIQDRRIIITGTNISKKRCVIKVMNKEMFKGLKIDTNFGYAFSEGDTPEYVLTSYEELLNILKQRGSLTDYKEYDIKYQRFKLIHYTSFGGFFWRPIELWTNYGYNKEWILYWTILFLLIFTVINYFYFPFLNRYVYLVENVPAPYELTFGKRIWYSFYYTATIFFKLTLKLEKLKPDRKGPVLYILFMYILGIICLAYMANFILQK